jgi:hypothetical protein
MTEYFTTHGQMTRVSWWNNFTDSDDVFAVDGVVYEAISVSPADNIYFEADTYYLPKKHF